MSRFNSSVARALFCAEMRMVLRDRRVLFTALLLPSLLMPLLLLGSQWSVKKRERALSNMVCRYVVAGSKAAEVRALVTSARQRSQASGERFLFEEAAAVDPAAELASNKVQLILEGDVAPEKTADGRPAVAKEKSARGAQAKAGEAPVPNATVVLIRFRGDRDSSLAGLGKMDEALRGTRRLRRDDLLRSVGLHVAQSGVASVNVVDVGSKANAAGLALGRGVTALFMMLILTGGAVVATDSVAGEKERGTLETLLTTSARRVEIMFAKHMVIVAVALAIAAVQFLNMFVYGQLKLLPLPSGSTIPISAMLLLLALYLPAIALASGVLLLLSSRARSYKDAQLYLLPVFLLGLLPALAPLLPGLELRSAVVLVPIANIALAAKDLLSGNFDWPMLALAWFVTAAAAAWTARLTVSSLSTESLITAADSDAIDLAGGPALFPRQVARWFVGMWAVLLMVSSYMEKVDLRVQVLINLVGIFFGGSCLMMWRYRLSARETLALRVPKLLIWPAVLVGVPGGLLTATGVYLAVDKIFPVSSAVLEQFQQALLPESITATQLVFFIAVLPGLFEEIAFRGLLLHGLSRRMHPAAVALVVGAVFGLFHAALFRLAPTAALGVMLAAVTLLTGSIFPAMLWHMLSNGLSLLLQHLEIPLDDLEARWYLAGAALLVAAFWIIYRCRTPYPGLRPWRRSKAAFPMPDGAISSIASERS